MPQSVLRAWWGWRAQGAQAPAPARTAGGAAARAEGAGGRGRGPAPVAPAKLARISLMTLNFNAYLKNPNNPNPTPDQTLTLFDLPKMYVEIYGVHNIEYQHTTIVQSETDPAFIKELKAKLDENKIDDDPDQPGVRRRSSRSPTTERGGTPAGDRPREAVDRHRRAVRLSARDDQPAAGQLTKETRARAVAAWKAMADYGRTKNVKVSAETRGAGTPE